jgi:hypothetical protein
MTQTKMAKSSRLLASDRSPLERESKVPRAVLSLAGKLSDFVEFDVFLTMTLYGCFLSTSHLPMLPEIAHEPIT